MKSSNIEINTNVTDSIDGGILNYEDIRSTHVYICMFLYISKFIVNNSHYFSIKT